MKIKLLQNWKHESGKVYPKDTILDMHPADGNKLIAEKIGKEHKTGIIQKLKDKLDGNDRTDKR